MNGAMKVILLVEDNPDDAKLVQLAFKRGRVMNPIVVVRDGIEALDFLFARGAYSERAGPLYPMIILDLNLPRLDGLGVLKVIRADAQLQELPILILTSSKEEEDLISAASLGLTTYLRKPVIFPEFVEAVKTLGAYWLMIAKGPQETIVP
jgi:two-component system response regulator